MPLVSIHADAMLASLASMAAMDQGKFWEYHDQLMANQKALSRADLERYAESVSLDLDAFRKALDAEAHEDVISIDVREAQQSGVRGTPTVFLNGQRYQGPRGYPPEGLEAVAATFLGL